MRQSNKRWSPALTVAAAGLALAACGGAATAASSVSRAPSKDVKTASTSRGTILVNSKGRSLYDLSVERKGHFICTGSCTQTWHPLRSKHKSPTGSVGHLSFLKRPDGTQQVAYKGHPLYTFSGDTKAGQTNGQGFKDVGTWSVIKVKTSSSTTNQPPAPAPTTYPGY
jgi:predicted lipoprotein with Yx(FWY)xxD motif